MTKDHNRENLALQRRIGELNAMLIQRDDQMRELQHQLATAKAQLADYREQAKEWVRIIKNNVIVK